MCGLPAAAAAATAGADRGPTGSTPRSASAAAGSARAANAEATTSSPAGTRLPWLIGAIAIALVLAVILVPRMGSDPAPPVTTAGGAAQATGDPRDIDLTSMTPDDAAIRLFGRVMTLAEAGDSAQARTFAPMAIAAYGLVPELTLDYRYDLAMIHFVNGEPEAAAAQADTILATAPTHLFGLAAAAEAAALLGDTTAARDYYQRFLDNYDSEVANNAAAYEAHPPVPAAMRMAAVAYLDATN